MSSVVFMSIFYIFLYESTMRVRRKGHKCARYTTIGVTAPSIATTAPVM
jgi:hypothetical protein